MSAPAIKVEGLSKRYKLGLTHAGSIREAVNRGVRRLTRRGEAHRSSSATQEAHDPDRVEDGHFWALKDVSFEVQPGEVVGIIGKNGAGKSTLLKILSRITKPTSGRCTLRGRVASLLEVGTGFHPELTGRENVYMNGTILGMTKREIDRRFDEIVAFAEVEKFIDTPVKRYSSGMTVRLGFAVAAHLNPEILIVDEVLAVGDLSFQRRCLDKLDTVAHAGKTVLFVSHNLGAVQSLCRRGLLIGDGQLVTAGPVQDVIARYHGTERGAVTIVAAELERLGWDTPLQFTNVQTTSIDGTPQARFTTGTPVRFVARLECAESITTQFAFAIHDGLGQLIMNLLSIDDRALKYELWSGEYELDVTLTSNCLKDGRYYLSLWAAAELGRTPYDYRPYCLAFYVDNTSVRKIHSAALVHGEAAWKLHAAPTSNRSPE